MQKVVVLCPETGWSLTSGHVACFCSYRQFRSLPQMKEEPKILKTFILVDKSIGMLTETDEFKDWRSLPKEIDSTGQKLIGEIDDWNSRG